MYSPVVQQLVHNLPNRGRVEPATHSAGGENPICGDRVELSIQINGGQIVDCRFQASGCPAAIASAAAVTLLVRDRALEEALNLTEEKLLEFLGGLPSHKLHGAQLAVEVLQRALRPDPL